LWIESDHKGLLVKIMGTAVTISTHNQDLREKVTAGKITWPWTVWMLVSRIVLFTAWQAAFALGFRLGGVENSWWAAAAWWPVSVVLANLTTLLLLRTSFRREGARLVDVYRFDFREVKQDFLILLGFLVIAGPAGFLPNGLIARLLFGDPQEPFDLFIRRCPTGRHWLAWCSFPSPRGWLSCQLTSAM
jgi:hypothetical protein